MKLTSRFEPFAVKNDPLSAQLDGIRLDLFYFTHWPVQDKAKLSNLVSSHIKVVFQVSGESAVTSGGRTFRLGPGSVAVIPPYRLYSGEALSGVDSYEVFLNVSPITREQDVLKLLGLENIAVFSGSLSEEAVSRIRNIYTAVHESSPGSRLALESLILRFLLAVPGRPAPEAVPFATPREQELISRLLGYIDLHMAEDISVDALAEEFGVSPSFLYRCSKKVMNCSTVQIITRTKLKRARILLRDPALSIGDVAAALGYDPFYFSAGFKKQFGIFPSDYRKTMLQAE